MIDTDTLLEKLDGEGLLKDLFPSAGAPDPKGEVALLCPYHADSEPSCHANVLLKVFRCKACGAKGTFIDLYAKVKLVARHEAARALADELGVDGGAENVSGDVVERFYLALRKNSEALDTLKSRKGLGLESIEHWRLGWDAQTRRLVIPVTDDRGLVVNLRKYDLFKLHEPSRKYINLVGRGRARLWPQAALADKEDPVIITEGELKVIYLRDLGWNAVTGTGGANTWRPEWSAHFTGRAVAIIYDVDLAGQVRSRAVADALLKAGVQSVKVVKLPLDAKAHPHGDVIDYFVRGGYTSGDLRNLIDATDLWTGSETIVKIDDPTVYPVELFSASKAQYTEKRVQVRVLVSAKDHPPYVVPHSVMVQCSRNEECCPNCPVFSQSLETEWPIEPDDPRVLELVDVKKSQKNDALRAFLGIPEKCHSSEITEKTAQNVEEVRLVPQVGAEVNSSADAQAVVRGYFVGHGLETNAAYELEGRATVEPTSQRATLLVYKATPNVDNLTSFTLTEQDVTELQRFTPPSFTVEGIEAKFGEIYTDLEENITRIYGRRTLHQVIDFTYHSPLYLTFGGETVKGWMDTLVIGSSGSGKTQSSSRLWRHYGLGERVDMKSASVAGLKGGLEETQGRWWVQWGAVPLNDRGLVILDEVKGAPVEVLQSLTDMRSSGIAELAKIERRRTYARTRLLWISNPRSARPVSSYNYGVETITELLGTLEDVRRFDVALVVESSEVDVAGEIDRARSGSVVAHWVTAPLSRKLILWAWSRRPDQVTFTPEAERAVLDVAKSQSTRYHGSIPLVEPGDHRHKIARLSAAVAARTFSASADGEDLLVTEAHVRWAAKWIDQIYGSRAMGYTAYSRALHDRDRLLSPAELKERLLNLEYGAAVMRGLISTKDLTVADVEVLGELNKDQAKDLVSLLYRSNALHRKGNVYYKTPVFITALREWLNELEGDQAPTRPAQREDY